MFIMRTNKMINGLKIMTKALLRFIAKEAYKGNAESLGFDNMLAFLKDYAAKTKTYAAKTEAELKADLTRIMADLELNGESLRESLEKVRLKEEEKLLRRHQTRMEKLNANLEATEAEIEMLKSGLATAGDKKELISENIKILENKLWLQQRIVMNAALMGHSVREFRNNDELDLVNNLQLFAIKVAGDKEVKKLENKPVKNDQNKVWRVNNEIKGLYARAQAKINADIARMAKLEKETENVELPQGSFVAKSREKGGIFSRLVAKVKDAKENLSAKVSGFFKHEKAYNFLAGNNLKVFSRGAKKTTPAQHKTMGGLLKRFVLVSSAAIVMAGTLVTCTPDKSEAVQNLNNPAPIVLENEEAKPVVTREMAEQELAKAYAAIADAEKFAAEAEQQMAEMDAELQAELDKLEEQMGGDKSSSDYNAGDKPADDVAPAKDNANDIEGNDKGVSTEGGDPDGEGDDSDEITKPADSLVNEDGAEAIDAEGTSDEGLVNEGDSEDLPEVTEPIEPAAEVPIDDEVIAEDILEKLEDLHEEALAENTPEVFDAPAETSETKIEIDLPEAELEGAEDASSDLDEENEIDLEVGNPLLDDETSEDFIIPPAPSSDDSGIEPVDPPELVAPVFEIEISEADTSKGVSEDEGDKTGDDVIIPDNSLSFSATLKISNIPEGEMEEFASGVQNALNDFYNHWSGYLNQEYPEVEIEAELFNGKTH